MGIRIEIPARVQYLSNRAGTNIIFFFEKKIIQKSMGTRIKIPARVQYLSNRAGTNIIHVPIDIH
jgi:hypothetical protein